MLDSRTSFTLLKLKVEAWMIEVNVGIAATNLEEYIAEMFALQEVPRPLAKL